MPAYNVSKSAVNAWTVHLAHELKDTGIKVNTIHPGYVQTEMNKSGDQQNGELSVPEGARTSVRLAPRPRSEIVSAPTPPFSTNAVDVTAVICDEPAATVVDRRSEAMSLIPSAAASSATMMSIGAADEKLLVRREPVTMTRSVSSSTGGSAGWVVSTVAGVVPSCANAGKLTTVAKTPSATDRLSRPESDP